jgi:hypothetical protein
VAYSVSRSIWINAPPEACWSAFVDVDQVKQWNPQVLRLQWVEGEPWTKGSVYVEKFKKGPFWANFRPVVTESLYPRRLTWQDTYMRSTGEHSYDFVSWKGGTLLTNTETFEGGLPILPGIILRLSRVGRQFERNLSSFKRHVESNSGTQAGE